MIPTKDDLIYEVCAALGRSEDDAVLSLVDKLLLMFERQQLLQQTPCTTLREELEQMIKEENEALGKAGYYEQYKRERHANQKYCLAIVKQMIDERQPVA